MAINRYLLPVLLLLVFSSRTWAWYDNNWHYRVPIDIPAGTSVNSTVKVDIDFAALLTTLGVVGSFDINSPRVVRSDDTTLVTTQEFTDAVYAGATDATANSRGEVRFILQDAGTTTYYLYFDVVANGPKAVNPQQEINGNFEADATGTVTPTAWTSYRSDANMDLSVRPAETVNVKDTTAGTSPDTFNTNGNPNTGNFSYLLGFRTQSDLSAQNNTNAKLTRNITIPASNPGNLKISFKPQGWDSGKNSNLNQFDFLQVRLLNPNNSNVLLTVVGPTLNNYATCPFSPNYGTTQAASKSPGYGPYNNWDNGKDSDNHTLGMSSTYNRRKEPWISCSASLSALAGQTVSLEIKMSVVNEYRSWFLLDDVEWSVVSVTPGAPQALVVTVPPTDFNAFDSTTAANSTTGVLKTKVAGTAFSFDVVALAGSPASVLTSFTQAVKVELVDGSGSADCASRTAIQTVAASYTFLAAEQGRHTFSGVSQAQAYADVLVRISYPDTSSTLVVCSSDHFAIRPDNFVAGATDGNWVSAGNTRTLNATIATATPTHKAGRPFTITATAYNSVGGVTTGYNGAPTASFTCTLPGSGCVAGILNAGMFAVSNGVAISSTASYSEVGVISATINDTGFAAVDAGDGSTLAERSIVSAAFPIGRFVPDRLDAALNTPVFTPGCDGFTYVGQPIKYSTRPVATVTAANSAGSTTQNYTGSLWKISPSDASYGISPSYSEAGHALTVLNSTAPTVVDNGNGTGTLSFADTTSNILGVTRSGPVAPFNAEIALSFTLQDTDAVQVGNVDGAASNNPVKFGTASAGNGIAFTSGNKTQRWGRLAIGNAYGSELYALSVPLFSEYFNGTSFVGNVNDNCTALNLNSHLQLSNPVTGGGAAQAGNAVMTIAPSGTSNATLANSPFVEGDAGLSFNAPGAGNTGYIDISGNFADLPWLLFDWDNNGVQDNSPSARASFGIYKGNSKQIYLREVY